MTIQSKTQLKYMLKPLQKITGIAQTLRIVCMSAAVLLGSFQLRALPTGRQAQGITVSGTITDKGAPLPGVSILVRGTTSGTTSDSDGKYTLAVPDNSGTLIFSFIGYKTQEIEVGNRTEL